MKDIILGIVRHTLTTLGGALITKGILTGTQFNDVLGNLMIIIGTIWSAVEKLPAKPVQGNKS